MPTYEYECRACGHRFEKYQSITAAPVRTCPKCRKARVRRLLGAGAALLFKGPGFYATDYPSSSHREGAKKEAAAETASAPKKEDAPQTPPKPSAAGGRAKAE
jgi:putative FmdB family regulatory protein